MEGTWRLYIYIYIYKSKKRKSTKVERERGRDIMEWRKCYLDVILVPLGFLITAGYHGWLWHNVRTKPETTIIGINTRGRRLWVSAMIKVPIYNNTILDYPSRKKNTILDC